MYCVIFVLVCCVATLSGSHTESAEKQKDTGKEVKPCAKIDSSIANATDYNSIYDKLNLAEYPRKKEAKAANTVPVFVKLEDDKDPKPVPADEAPPSEATTEEYNPVAEAAEAKPNSKDKAPAPQSAPGKELKTPAEAAGTKQDSDVESEAAWAESNSYEHDHVRPFHVGCPCNHDPCCDDRATTVDLTRLKRGITNEIPGVIEVLQRPETHYSHFSKYQWMDCFYPALLKVKFDRITNYPVYGGLCTETPSCGHRFLRLDFQLGRYRSSGHRKMFNIGDSATNYGEKYDYPNTQRYDANVDGRNNILKIHGNEYCTEDEPFVFDGALAYNVKSFSIWLGAEYIRVRNDQGFDKRMCSKCLFALNGQPDYTVDQYIYIGINRAISCPYGHYYDNYMFGHGVCSVILFWECPWNDCCDELYEHILDSCNTTSTASTTTTPSVITMPPTTTMRSTTTTSAKNTKKKKSKALRKKSRKKTNIKPKKEKPERKKKPKKNTKIKKKMKPKKQAKPRKKLPKKKWSKNTTPKRKKNKEKQNKSQKKEMKRKKA